MNAGFVIMGLQRRNVLNRENEGCKNLVFAIQMRKFELAAVDFSYTLDPNSISSNIKSEGISSI